MHGEVFKRLLLSQPSVADKFLYLQNDFNSSKRSCYGNLKLKKLIFAKISNSNFLFNLCLTYFSLAKPILRNVTQKVSFLSDKHLHRYVVSDFGIFSTISSSLGNNF